MAGRRKYDIAAVVVVVLGIAAYASFRKEYRLRPDMPVEFFDSSGIAGRKGAQEKAMANAYWQCAVKQIQWKYGYAHRLPEQPPTEFSIGTVQGTPESAAVRLHYWQKLRAAWGITAAWEQQYEWNTISLGDSLRSAGQWLETHMRRIVGY
jgi:hypothetical protein